VAARPRRLYGPQAMEGREGPDPGYDDWFDEPEPPAETQSSAGRAAYEGDDEVWVLPEEESPRAGHRREFVVAGRTLTTTQVAIIAGSILALLLAILAAAGVFSSSKPAAPPVATPPPPPKVTTTATTNTVTTPTVQAPNTTLSPGDTGSQVKLLQQALISLGYTLGKPDGDYGPATQVAVEKFQVAKGLAEDGVVGPETLAKLQQALAG
jgi:Putative peptidoglycan binding domain